MFSLNKGENIHCAYPVIKETLPRSSLGYHSNNVYPEFPPLMADGRSLIATYQPEAVVNADILSSTGIKSNLDYRKYLTHNANKIMEYNFKESCNDVGYYKRFQRDDAVNPSPLGTMTPHMYSSLEDNTRVQGVANSDLKKLYLSREVLNSKKVAPTITQDELYRQMGRR